MRATPDVARTAPTLARRRRERRIRSFFSHEQLSVKMTVISAQHHSAQRCCSIATQTDDYVATSATFFNMSDGDDSDEPAAPVTEYVAPAPDVTHAAPAHTDFVTSAPVTEYIAPARVASACTNLDDSGMMNPQLSTTAPKRLLAHFSLRAVSQVHQEQIIAGETTQNTVGFHPVQVFCTLCV